MFNIFKKNKTKLPFNDFAEYYFGAEVSATGDCKTDQDIYIDGRFDGTLSTTGLVELAKNSSVSANIEARSVIVEGDFKGKIKAEEELKITSCASLVAEIITANMVVDKNAIVNGTVKMKRV